MNMNKKTKKENKTFMQKTAKKQHKILKPHPFLRDALMGLGVLWTRWSWRVLWSFLANVLQQIMQAGRSVGTPNSSARSGWFVRMCLSMSALYGKPLSQTGHLIGLSFLRRSRAGGPERRRC